MGAQIILGTPLFSADEFQWERFRNALSGSEAGGDLVLIQTSPSFSCKCELVSIRTT